MIHGRELRFHVCRFAFRGLLWLTWTMVVLCAPKKKSEGRNDITLMPEALEWVNDLHDPGKGVILPYESLCVILEPPPLNHRDVYEEDYLHILLRPRFMVFDPLRKFEENAMSCTKCKGTVSFEDFPKMARRIFDFPYPFWVGAPRYNCAFGKLR